MWARHQILPLISHQILRPDPSLLDRSRALKNLVRSPTLDPIHHVPADPFRDDVDLIEDEIADRVVANIPLRLASDHI